MHPWAAVQPVDLAAARTVDLQCYLGGPEPGIPDRAVPVQYRPRRLVRTEPHLALLLGGGDADLAVHEMPRGNEPHGARGASAVEEIVPAVAETRRSQPAQRQRRSGARRPLSQLRCWAGEAVRPVEVVQALPVLVGPGPEPGGAWVVLTGGRRRPLRLRHRDGEPSSAGARWFSSSHYALG